jgi:importin-7
MTMTLQEFLLLQVVFPLLCLTDEDVELFETEPLEFMHRQTDPVLDFLDPRMPAINLIVDLVKYRAADTLPRLLGFVTEILSTYQRAPPEQRDYRRKDGAFVALG